MCLHSSSFNSSLMEGLAWESNETGLWSLKGIEACFLMNLYNATTVRSASTGICHTTYQIVTYMKVCLWLPKVETSVSKHAYRISTLLSCWEEEYCGESISLQITKLSLPVMHFYRTKSIIEQNFNAKVTVKFRRRKEYEVKASTLALGCSFVVPSILATTIDSMPRKCEASLLYVGSRVWQWPHHGAYIYITCTRKTLSC